MVRHGRGSFAVIPRVGPARRTHHDRRATQLRVTPLEHLRCGTPSTRTGTPHRRGHRVRAAQARQDTGFQYTPVTSIPTRTVPPSDTVAAAVSEHLRGYPVEGESLANTARGPINRGSFNARIWKPALVAAGIAPTRDNGMHALRHTYASVLLAEGVSIRAVADYLGHESAAFTLQVYTHLMPDDDERARSVIDAALGARVGQAWANAGGA